MSVTSTIYFVQFFWIRTGWGQDSRWNPEYGVYAGDPTLGEQKKCFCGQNPYTGKCFTHEMLHFHMRIAHSLRKTSQITLCLTETGKKRRESELYRRFARTPSFVIQITFFLSRNVRVEMQCKVSYKPARNGTVFSKIMIRNKIKKILK